MTGKIAGRQKTKQVAAPMQRKFEELDVIEVKGAEEHNLKHVDVVIPKKKLVVFTGVSGSGKSSLAFDTIFAEGQRRYVESLSSYARQFLGQMEKPRYETIRGLAPTISIEQKAASKNPRSTVGTITEVYDYLRVLYARMGQQNCHLCGKPVGKGDPESMVEQILQEAQDDQSILLLAPKLENRKGVHRELFDEAKEKGYSRVRVNGLVSRIDDVQTLAKHKKHTIEVVVDRLKVQKSTSFRQRLTDSVETCLREGQGQMLVHFSSEEGRAREIKMSEHRSCCGFAFPELDPPLFSFNSPLGMCQSCNGLGSVLQGDETKLISDPNLSIREGAIIPWRSYFLGSSDDKEGSWSHERFTAMEEQWAIDFDRPWKKLPKKHRDLIMYGSKPGQSQFTLEWEDENSTDTWTYDYEGLVPMMMRRYLKTKSDSMKTWYQKFMSNKPCPDCQGKRLKPEVRAVHVRNHSIVDLCQLSIRDCRAFFTNMKLSPQEKLISSELLKEIQNRLSFLENVGLGYLSLNRHGPSLSGGEAQRIRLASQIGSELTGVLYILDEPSIGLHQRDNQKLLSTLQNLRDIGNSLIVVEHDQETIEAADWVVDFGPGAGINGGQVVASGTPAAIKRAKDSLTGQYLSGKLQIGQPSKRRKPSNGKAGSWLEIHGAKENNLKNVDISIPIGLFTVVSGVSGAGKSTLINQILYPAMANRLHQTQHPVGQHSKILGLEAFDKVINIDQKPIGRTPRSNPATYTKVFDHIRDFFALLPEAKVRGYDKGRFSFNVKGGRCEACQGDGYLKVEMHFLADVYVPCDVCHGKRFNQATCEIRYRDKSISDVLDLSVAEARELFSRHPRICAILDTLIDVGLSYIKIGQAATTLSGGEAQRIKLARELAKKDTGRTLYILDEPTTGLHFHDIKHLLEVLHRLVDAGNTIVVIEHNLDVIQNADWIIDMGPEGGDEGGFVLGSGSPEEIKKIKASHTGAELKRL